MKNIQATLLGIALGATILLGQSLLSNAPTAKNAEPSSIARMLPDDLGQKSVIWLEMNKDGGLTMNYEKHQVVSYGMASVPVSEAVTRSLEKQNARIDVGERICLDCGLRRGGDHVAADF